MLAKAGGSCRPLQVIFTPVGERLLLTEPVIRGAGTGQAATRAHCGRSTVEYRSRNLPCGHHSELTSGYEVAGALQTQVKGNYHLDSIGPKTTLQNDQTVVFD